MLFNVDVPFSVVASSTTSDGKGVGASTASASETKVVEAACVMCRMRVAMGDGAAARRVVVLIESNAAASCEASDMPTNEP